MSDGMMDTSRDMARTKAVRAMWLAVAEFAEQPTEARRLLAMQCAHAADSIRGGFSSEQTHFEAMLAVRLPKLGAKDVATWTWFLLTIYGLDRERALELQKLAPESDRLAAVLEPCRDGVLIAGPAADAIKAEMQRQGVDTSRSAAVLLSMDFPGKIEFI